MKVYVTVIEDRHAEPAVYVFSNSETAIGYARRKAIESAHRPEDFQESEIDGWLYYATYSCENDCVWVVEKMLDETSEKGRVEG